MIATGIAHSTFILLPLYKNRSRNLTSSASCSTLATTRLSSCTRVSRLTNTVVVVSEKSPWTFQSLVDAVQRHELTQPEFLTAMMQLNSPPNPQKAKEKAIPEPVAWRIPRKPRRARIPRKMRVRPQTLPPTLTRMTMTPVKIARS